MLSEERAQRAIETAVRILSRRDDLCVVRFQM
jgi:hypothetical protein